MGWWEEHVVPRMVDVTCAQRPVMELRREVCAGLGGRVLEVGFGSGLNLGALPREVTEVHAVEPSDVAWRRSAERRAESRVPVHRIGLDGQRIDTATTFDSALVTFSLCTIPDPALALGELVRLLAPGSGVHFIEHGLAPDEGVRRWQRRLEPLQRRVAGGCHLTRDPVALVVQAGLAIQQVRHTYLGPGPGKVFGYVSLGRAVTPA